LGACSVPACGGCKCVGRKCRVADTGVAPNTSRISIGAKNNHCADVLAAVKWLEKDANGARRHSDKEKFRSDLNRPESYEMSERLLKTLRKFADFQSEYSSGAASRPALKALSFRCVPSSRRCVVGAIISRYGWSVGFRGTRSLNWTEQG
jgi:hypothetical protein